MNTNKISLAVWRYYCKLKKFLMFELIFLGFVIINIAFGLVYVPLCLVYLASEKACEYLMEIGKKIESLTEKAYMSLEEGDE